MKLLFKQRLFSWFDSYDIYDENGQTVYTVQGQLAWGHCLKIYDARGVEIGTVKQRILTFLPKFEMYLGDRYIGCISKEFTFFFPKYYVDFRGWDVDGDMLNWDYEVTQGNRTVMHISKEWLTWGDTYTLRYDNIQDEIPGLLLVIAIDAVNCSKNK